jgi:Tfp pilus assembly protein PilF
VDHSLSAATAPVTSRGRPRRRALPGWTAPLLIVAAGAAAYANSFSGPFVFDAAGFIRDNPGIRRLWPPLAVMFAGNGAPARPLPNYTFAVNYALHGLDPIGFHVVNLLIHLAAALTLFAIVRRTLSSGPLAVRYGRSATGLALAVAVLWAVHPLQTQAVTYIYQRMESLMGLFFLLTLYGFRRGADSANPRLAYVGSVAACVCGMLSKEVMVAAPLVVLLYDRIFVAASWRAIWSLRWKYYLALASTWLILGLVVFGQRQHYHEFQAATCGPLEYVASQPGVLLWYLRLVLWPTGQCLDYGWPVAHRIGDIAPAGVAVLLLLLATLGSLWKWPPWGFLGGWLFLILAPTSSVLPVTDLAVEHRMYLPLAAVIAALVMGGDLLLGVLLRRLRVPTPRRTVLQGTIAAALVTSAVVALGVRTWLRNEDYRTNLWIWEDAVRQRPLNERAHDSLGNALADSGRVAEAIEHYQKALEIKPSYAGAHNNLALALVGRGSVAEAIRYYQKALEIQPSYADAHYNLGTVLIGCGRVEEAIVHFQKALEINPDYAAAHNNLALALGSRGRVNAAIAHFQKALEIQPDYARAHNNLGNTLVSCGRVGEAIAHYRKALELNPDYAEAHNNLGTALATRGELSEAIAHFQKALEIQPDYTKAHNNLGMALTGRGEIDAAVNHFQRVVQLTGNRDPIALDLLAATLAKSGRFLEAIATARKALALAHEKQNKLLAEALEARLGLYRSGLSLHHAGPSAPSAAR